MRELDAILASFLRTSYAGLPPGDKARFRALLELPDPELHAYLLGRYDGADPSLERLLDRIRSDFNA